MEGGRNTRRRLTSSQCVILLAVIKYTAAVLLLGLSKDKLAEFLLIKMHFNLARGTHHPLRTNKCILFQVSSKLTTEFWRPPLVNFSSSLLASSCVGLKLVTQNILRTVVPAHVEHTILEEGSGIHHCDAIPGRKERTGTDHSHGTKVGERA